MGGRKAGGKHNERDLTIDRIYFNYTDYVEY
jgi:hypothetical protein